MRLPIGIAKGSLGALQRMKAVPDLASGSGSHDRPAASGAVLDQPKIQSITKEGVLSSANLSRSGRHLTFGCTPQ